MTGFSSRGKLETASYWPSAYRESRGLLLVAYQRNGIDQSNRRVQLSFRIAESNWYLHDFTAARLFAFSSLGRDFAPLPEALSHV